MQFLNRPPTPSAPAADKRGSETLHRHRTAPVQHFRSFGGGGGPWPWLKGPRSHCAGPSGPPALTPTCAPRPDQTFQRVFRGTSTSTFESQGTPNRRDAAQAREAPPAKPTAPTAKGLTRLLGRKSTTKTVTLGVKTWVCVRSSTPPPPEVYPPQKEGHVARARALAPTTLFEGTFLSHNIGTSTTFQRLRPLLRGPARPERCSPAGAQRGNRCATAVCN